MTVNAQGTNAVDPAVSDQYPALDNTACTATGVPYTCCRGAGSGSCRALPDFRATGGGLPAAFACKTLNPLFDNASYIGGVNPTETYNATAYDWLSKPWLEFGDR